MTDLIVSTLTQGLLYSLVAFGVYITYSILDFPDLSVDGTFPLGAALTAGLLLRGADPWAALAVAAAAGMLAGAFTGFIHVVFRIRNLLAGIITQTALFSLNLLINGTSNVMLDRNVGTIFTVGPAAALGGLSLGLRRLIVAALVVLAVKILLDLDEIRSAAPGRRGQQHPGHYPGQKHGLRKDPGPGPGQRPGGPGGRHCVPGRQGLYLHHGHRPGGLWPGGGDYRHFPVPQGVLRSGDHGGAGGQYPV